MTDRWFIFSLERTHDEESDDGMFAEGLSFKLRLYLFIHFKFLTPYMSPVTAFIMDWGRGEGLQAGPAAS